MRTGPAAQGDRMLAGQALYPGQGISAANGRYTFTYQVDSNLVLYENPGRPIWASGTDGRPVGVCLLEENGNLVIYDPDGNPIWFSGTSQPPGSRLVLENDGKVVIYGRDNLRVWENSSLLGSLKIFHAIGSTAAHPETTLTVPDGYKILGGGAQSQLERAWEFVDCFIPKGRTDLGR
jgi:hypothetical protein